MLLLSNQKQGGEQLVIESAFWVKTITLDITIIIINIFIIFNSSQLKAFDFKYFEIISVNTSTNQLPKELTSISKYL